jgi:hypothetical protein
VTMTQLHPVPRETLQAAHALLVAAERDARVNLVKAATPASLRRRSVRLAIAADELTVALDEYFAGMADRILPVAKAVAPWDPDSADWAREDALLRAALERTAEDLGPDAYAGVNAELGLELDFQMDGPSVKPVMTQIGNDVTAINDVSRQKLRRLIAEGVERGYSMGQIVRGVPDDGFAGLRNLVDGWSSTGAGQGTSRAAAIARTETANVYNHLALSGYNAGGIASVLVFDGRDCGWTSHEDPDKANGTIRTLVEARQHVIAHPNCGRAFGASIA